MRKNVYALALFKKRLDKAFDEKVIEQLNQRKKLIASSLLSAIVIRSPFWSGSYIISHTVSLNKPAIGYNRLIYGTRTWDQVRSESLSKGNAIIMASHWRDNIIIRNNVPHALNVEYLGWESKPPYHVYQLSTEYMRHKAKQIMKQPVKTK